MKRSILFLLLLCFGCSSKPKAPAVQISLVNNNRSVEFKGLDYAVVNEINRDSVQGVWQGLIPVYRMPVDTDMKDYQPVQPGTYRLKDRSVVFTPDTPFAKGKFYFLRYYRFSQDQSMWDFIKTKKKLGHTPYIDLIFKQ
jgi:hypothetical protein